MNNIQEEVRKLHIQLNQKDQIINQLKVLYKKKEAGSVDDTMAEDQADLELEKITKAQTDIDVDTKAQEQEFVQALSSKKQVSDMSDYISSIMLNPSDIK